MPAFTLFINDLCNIELSFSNDDNAGLLFLYWRGIHHWVRELVRKIFGLEIKYVTFNHVFLTKNTEKGQSKTAKFSIIFFNNKSAMLIKINMF